MVDWYNFPMLSCWDNTTSLSRVECYCSTSDCQIDVDGDGQVIVWMKTVIHALQLMPNSDGYADSCIVDPIDIDTTEALSQTLYTLTNAPGRETDNDGDNFVECILHNESLGR